MENLNIPEPKVWIYALDLFTPKGPTEILAHDTALRLEQVGFIPFLEPPHDTLTAVLIMVL